MTASQVAAYKAMYRRQIDEIGEIVTFKRAGNPNVEVRARVTGFSPEELAGGIVQGDRKIIALEDDLVAASFPVPLKVGDQVIVRGRTLRLESVDASTRRVGDSLIAYEMQARG